MQNSQKVRGLSHEFGVTRIYDEEDLIEEFDNSLSNVKGYIPIEEYEQSMEEDVAIG